MFFLLENGGLQDYPSVVRKVKSSNMQQMKDDFYFKNQANCAAAGYIY